MNQYNLSIACVNGWVYGFICEDKNELSNFLREYDHEGSSISLVKRLPTGAMQTLYNEEVYIELEGEPA